VIEWPHCGTQIALVRSHDAKVIDGDSWVRDKAFFALTGRLSIKQRQGIAWFAEIAAGSRPCCGRDYILANVRMVWGSSVIEDFGDRYFLEAERACGVNFSGLRTKIEGHGVSAF
jgi:hypothetical protein